MFCVFKQKTAYEMRISDWSSDVCSSDLGADKGIDIDLRRVLIFDLDRDMRALVVGTVLGYSLGAWAQAGYRHQHRQSKTGFSGILRPGQPFDFVVHQAGPPDNRRDLEKELGKMQRGSVRDSVGRNVKDSGVAAT